MPSDLVGTRIYRPDQGSFDVEQGPVFANFLLADEINRAPAKVQSALLEVMQEHQVTIGHDTFKVPTPFLVLATENPIEAEGTYPLPEAQVDRFMLKILLDYPNPADEAQIVARSLAPAAAPREILDAAGLLRLQQTVTEVYVDPRLISYAVGLVEATRKLTYWGAPDLETYVSYGASPRGSINLIHGARAMALLHGRRYVLPSDIIALAPGRPPPPARAELRGPRRRDHRRHHRRARPLARPGAAPRDGGGADRMTARVGQPMRPRGRGRPRRRPRTSPASAGATGRAARPGPGPIADRLVRQLELSLDRRVGGRMSGDHLGRGHGTGLELDRLRPYEPGDDVRKIDWNATARTLVPQVREDVPDRQLTAWLLLDHSPSMHFGTADRRKADVAEGAALVVGRFAARRGNRLGVVTFGAGREAVTPPAGGSRGHARPPPGRRHRTGRRGRRRDLAGPRPRPSSARSGPRPASSSSSPTSAARATGSRPSPRSPAATRSSPSRSSTRARTRLVDVGELTLDRPRDGSDRSASTPAIAGSAPRSTRPPRPIAPRSPREFRRLGVRHLRLSTDGPWLPALAQGFTRTPDRTGRPA